MRKETVGFLRDELIYGHLFDTEDDAGFGDVLLDHGSGGEVVLHGVGATVARLDDDFDAIFDEFPDVAG